MKDKGEVTFQLPNKKINVKFIPKTTTLAPNADKTHIAYGGMLLGATMKYSAPLMKNNTIKNVLTNEEKAHLEELTQLNLSIYNGDFWNNFFVRLRRDGDGNTLDLSNPTDYISYKILQAYDKTAIAPDWASRNKILSYKFAITEEDEILGENNKSFNIKRDAFKAYSKIESQHEMLLNVLKLLENKPISPQTTIDRLQAKVSEYVDNEPAKFLSVVNDAQFETKALIMSGVEAGVINKTGNRYVTTDGLELCESGEIPLFTNAVNYLNQVRNQDVRSLIEAKIEASSKKAKK